MRIQFSHYDGMIKANGCWEFIGKYHTLLEARSRGATKCKPRFIRIR